MRSVLVVALALILSACAIQADRRMQIAAWQRCIDQSAQAHAWLSDCH